MQVIKAEVLGMCFGVRDALQILAELREPHRVTIHGELVHNETVLDQLSQRGFQMIQESQRRSLPVTETVLVRPAGRTRLLAVKAAVVAAPASRARSGGVRAACVAAARDRSP